jgi:hypothetical protein
MSSGVGRRERKKATKTKDDRYVALYIHSRHCLEKFGKQALSWINQGVYFNRTKPAMLSL